MGGGRVGCARTCLPLPSPVNPRSRVDQGNVMVPNARFIELLADIEPSATTKSNASSAHTNLRSHLRAHATFKKRWVTDFLAGSYSRDTAIRPRLTEDGHERPDVDIIVETNFTMKDTPDAVLKEVAKALEPAYTVERINKRSVRVTAWNAEMDVVPVIKGISSYWIPDRDSGGWKETNPPAHNQWSTDQNALFGQRFKPLVKLLKWWRRENPTGKRPKGFVLEVLVAKHAPQDEKHFGEAFARLLENIHAAYAGLAMLNIKPEIWDPAVPGNDILAKVTVTQWKDFMDKVGVHAGYARSAQKTFDMADATRLWRKVFGERFKETDASKSSDGSTYAAASGSVAAYTFPNANSAPTKPRGFA